MLDFRDFMLDSRKIAPDIQQKIAIFVGNLTKFATNRVGNQT